MRKKVRNNKTILASILALGCLTAASVGFSSWVIAAQDTSKTSNVSVTVADVEDHRFDVEASSNSKIMLAPNTNGLLISGASEEKLDFTFSLTFKAKGSSAEFNFKSLGDQSFDINFSFTNALDINKDGNEYIHFLSGTIGTISNSGFIASGTTDPKSSNVITYSGELAWGSYFDNKNPSELTDDTKVDKYIQGLNYLKTSLKDKSFVITVNIVKAV